MISRLLSLTAAAAFAMSASAGVAVTFDGTDNEGWDFGSQATVANGHVHVDMPGGNGAKYRQDFAYKGEAVKVDPSTDKVFAFKFIGAVPPANFTFEMTGGAGLVKKQNFRRTNNTANTFSTIGGNNVLYVDLSGDETYNSNTEAYAPSMIQVKVADVAADAEVHEYTIDWIKTYPSLDEAKADANWADDANDQDEANAPVFNTTTGQPFGSLTEAVDAATAGDEIVIKQDQTIGSRYGISKAVTISGATGNEVIKASNNNYIMFLIPNNVNAGSIAFKNLIFAGSGKSSNRAIFEINDGRNTVTFDNVTFKDFDLNSGDAIQHKNGGKSVLKNVAFENVVVPEGKSMVFLGINCQTTLGGVLKNASVYLENGNSKVFVEAAGVSGDPVAVSFKDGAFAVGAAVIQGTTNTEMFTLTNADLHLEADEANNNLVLAEGTLGIENVEIEENAPVEYFNLQGVKVAEPTPGLYIMRQGNRTAKVVVR